MLLVCGACGRLMRTATELAIHVEHHRYALRQIVEYVRRDLGEEPEVFCLITREAFPAQELADGAVAVEVDAPN